MATMAATASRIATPDIVSQHLRAASSTRASSSRCVALSLSTSFRGQASKSLRVSQRQQQQVQRRFVAIRAEGESGHGANPEWQDDDYIVLGLAHCFRKDENGKLQDAFVVEPVTAGTLECMENGGTTCYKCVTATTLGVALKEDLSLLPVEMQAGSICDEFEFRALCASRTWKRDHPQQNLLHIVPRDGVKSEYNFSLQDKRVLNAEVVVNDSDNIKQDMSIDVYGREKEEEISKEIGELYSV